MIIAPWTLLFLSIFIIITLIGIAVWLHALSIASKSTSTCTKYLGHTSSTLPTHAIQAYRLVIDFPMSTGKCKQLFVHRSLGDGDAFYTRCLYLLGTRTKNENPRLHLLLLNSASVVSSITLNNLYVIVTIEEIGQFALPGNISTSSGDACALSASNSGNVVNAMSWIYLV